MAWKENAKTKHVALNMLKAGVAITGAALLFACGDDDSSFVASENGGSAAEADIDVTIFDDLPSCVGKREGKTAYIKDEKATYVCTDGDWVVAGESGDEGDGDDDDGDNADKKSSSSTSKDEFLNPKISYGEMTDSRDNQVYKTVCGAKPYDPKKQYCLKVTRDETDIYSVEDLLTDTRDNKTYKTVKIGTQVWMAENLNYSVNPDEQSWCGGGNGDTEGDCSVYGRLYTWAAAIDSVALANDADNPQTCGDGKTCTLPTVVQGVCPEGWHLPSYDEWQTLFSAVGGSSKAGTALKSQTGWKSQTGRDAYGFSALPAGDRSNDGYFYDAGYYANFWSASEDDSYIACYMILYYSSEDAYQYDYDKNLGLSVRCLQN